MIKSMTGFGKGEYIDGKRSVVVEMRAVNHRYCDIHVKMPRRYSFAEEKIKSIVKNTVKRGKIDISVLIENISESDVTIKLNPVVAKQYMANLNELSNILELDNNATLEYIAGLPDVMKAIPDVEDEDEVFASIEKALVEAIENFDHMRIIEGKKLEEDLLMRGEIIRGHVATIEEKAPQLQEIYALKLKTRIEELMDGNVEVPEDRIMLEAAIFADKANITEELVRLDSHMIQLKNIIGGQKSEGKKLDFLVQEMNRETNTIGAKANDLKITQTMLEIKSEIEKIREQVQNIE